MPDEISDADCIARYCRPSSVINNLVRSSAFKIRNNENYLSANWIPKAIDTNMGLEQIRSILLHKNFDVTTNGRFVVFNTGVIKSYVYELTGVKITICHKPSSEDPTHVGILPNESDGADDTQKLMPDIALALFKFTRQHPHTVYPGLCN